MTESAVEHDVEVFFRKLVQCAGESGKLRWNAICEDLIAIYESKFTAKDRLIESSTLWSIFFEPKPENKETFKKLFSESKHRQIFMEILFKGLEDPKEWTEWVSTYRY